ncbi:histidine phosphatase family protein [Streptomyces sp. NRRL S-920]|uniref:histidine phosphatase family protein n=1 Tax=Streptomyces sp. NRRL S-920 TaxID=1463921 RepID=UPI0009966292|nr:histidine phosphatase family protein [Streptomyces sp. NRRL S-920]
MRLRVPQTGIVTSPLSRARQTAAIIAHVRNLPIVATSGLLAEWRAPSVVLGRTPATYPPAYRAWRQHRLTNPSLRFEDGESLTNLHTRASHCAEFLRRNAQKHGPLLAVSHKLLLSVLTRLAEGPAAFNTAAKATWQFAEIRLLPVHQPAEARPHRPSSLRTVAPLPLWPPSTRRRRNSECARRRTDSSPAPLLDIGRRLADLCGTGIATDHPANSYSRRLH